MKMKWKVYDPTGNCIASCLYGEDAAALVGMHGDGATIRVGARAIVWTEGIEEQDATESYDYVAYLIERRALSDA